MDGSYCVKPLKQKQVVSLPLLCILFEMSVEGLLWLCALIKRVLLLRPHNAGYVDLLIEYRNDRINEKTEKT